MTVAALIVAVLALAIVLRERRHWHTQREWIAERRLIETNGHPDWDWPRRPVNGHDHPEPPELIPEERA